MPSTDPRSVPLERRQGCLPASNWRNPAHDSNRNRDRLRVGLIHTDQYDSVRVLSDVTADEPKLAECSGQVAERPIYEIQTTNGERCYLTEWQDVEALLRLAAAGSHGVQRWMRGVPYEQAWTDAEQAWRPHGQIQATLSDTTILPPLADLKIEI